MVSYSMLLCTVTLFNGMIWTIHAAPDEGFEGYGEKHLSIDQLFAEINVGPRKPNFLLGEKSPGTLREYDIMDPPSPSTRKRRAIGIYIKWPHGIIPYVFGSGFNGKDAQFVQVFESAIKEFHEKTCLKLVPRSTESRYVTIISDGGCWSYIGMASISTNAISLMAPILNGGHCWHTGTIVHEFMHAFGVSHEQSRGDRDDHVEIIWNSIPSKYQRNFQKMANWVDTNSAYDYLSVMHYGRTAFGSPSGTTTIRTLDSSKQNLIGQRTGMTSLDAAQLNELYKTECAGQPEVTTPKPTTTKEPVETLHGIDLNNVALSVVGTVRCSVIVYLLLYLNGIL